jgi:hypothetical protein
MSAQADVERHRKAVQDLQKKIAAESRKVADARTKEGRARQQAAGTTSASTRSSRLREADRHSKAAIDAEKSRSDFETKLAAKQAELHKAEGKRDKEREVDQKRSMDRLRSQVRTREQQFRPRFAEAPRISDTGAVVTEKYDVFICHASEDKQELATPLAGLLRDKGLKVWFDKFVVTVGDSLSRKIDEGLAASRFGVVVLSPDFFKKEWPQVELDGLVTRQRASGQKIVLPIWHRITKDEVAARSPTLAGLLALNTSVMSVQEIADELVTVVRSES